MSTLAAAGRIALVPPAAIVAGVPAGRLLPAAVCAVTLLRGRERSGE